MDESICRNVSVLVLPRMSGSSRRKQITVFPEITARSRRKDTWDSHASAQTNCPRRYKYQNINSVIVLHQKIRIIALSAGLSTV